MVVGGDTNKLGDRVVSDLWRARLEGGTMDLESRSSDFDRDGGWKPATFWLGGLLFQGCVVEGDLEDTALDQGNLCTV